MSVKDSMEIDDGWCLILVGKGTLSIWTKWLRGVAAREEGIGAVDEETVERVASTLHHTYLPKLAEAGALDYDPESQRIVAEQISYSTGPVPTSLVPDDWFHTHQLRRPDLEFLARTNQTNLEGLDGDENLFSRP